MITHSIKEFLARHAVAKSRWEDTLIAIKSIKQGKTIEEDEVNTWLNTWGTNERKKLPRP